MMARRHPTFGQGVAIDVAKLVESRLLIQANSGAGKSWAIRRLLEQTYGDCQHIVLDVEGEFHSLRQRFDYVLAGKDGDCPADLKSAALLARRLLELSVSAIIDISELGTQRRLFVQRFLDSLIEAPRDLWHPALIVVDEAHMFCPEAGKAESADAVKDLMTRGRKRGFGGVLATQRISKLHKDAAAEANNKLIGRSVQDIDMKRAADELGFTSREDMLKLRRLQPGEFYAFGPAISADVVHFKVGAVETTHPKAGGRAAAPTPPRERIQKVLAQLADLPHEAEEEARTADELRGRVRELERELRSARAVSRAAPPPKLERVNVPLLEEKHVRTLSKLFERFDALVKEVGVALGEVVADRATRGPSNTRKALADALARPTPTPAPPPRAAPTIAARSVTAGLPGSQRPTPAQQRLLDTIRVIEQFGIEPDLEVVAAWAKSHPRSKGFANNIGALRSMGFVDGFRLTPEGQAAATGAFTPRGTVEDIVMSSVSPAQRRIVELVLQHQNGLSQEVLGELLNCHPRTKSLANNVGALRSRGVVSKSWPLRPTRVLVPGGV
jgi:hypothetical protein